MHTQEVEFLFPPMSFLQIQDDEYLEIALQGPVRVIPVRVNVNQLAPTCEQIVGQKKDLHIQSFEHAVWELGRELLEQGDTFAKRLEKDSTARFVKEQEPGYGLKQLADVIIDDCTKQLEEHRQLAPSQYLEDSLFQTLVHEMLSVVHMGRSKLQLYLEDDSRYIRYLKNMPSRAAHRENLVRMYRLLQQASSSSCDTQASGNNNQKTIARRLCKEEGLLRESVTEKNELGETRIMVAAADDWKPAHIQLLVAAGADVNEKIESDGTTPTMKAATCGHTETVKELAGLGADVKAVRNDGGTAVMLASQGGHTATVAALAAVGADVNASANDGNTAVMSAAHGGHTATVTALAGLGADVKAAANDGSTAVMSAAHGGHTATVMALAELGADVKAAANDCSTAVMSAAQGGHTATVTALAGLGADVKAADRDDFTAVMAAAQGGHTATVTALAGLGADVNASNINGKTAVMFAAAGGYTDIVMALAKIGADLNASDNKGRTALISAACRGLWATVEVLSDLGADVTAADNDGMTAVMFAAQEGHTGGLGAEVTAALGAEVTAPLTMGRSKSYGQLM